MNSWIFMLLMYREQRGYAAASSRNRHVPRIFKKTNKKKSKSIFFSNFGLSNLVYLYPNKDYFLTPCIFI